MARNPIKRISRELDDAIRKEMNRFQDFGLDISYIASSNIIAKKIEGVKEVKVSKTKKKCRIFF